MNYKLFATEASKKYIEDGISMNDTILKQASDNNFNKHQIERVVEQANQITYLSLFDKGSDKYASVQFEVADPDYIKSKLFKPVEKTARLYMDDYKDVGLSMDKAAEESTIPTQPKESFWKRLGYFQKQAKYLKAKSGENRIKFQEELDKFASYARSKILLNELSFEDLNTAFPENFVEKVAEIYNIPGHEKTASQDSNFYINEKHPLYESFQRLSDLEDEYIELHKEARSLYSEVSKEKDNDTITGGNALIGGIASDIAKAWNVIKEVPAKHLVGYPAAFLLGVMYQKTQKDQQATLTTNDVPLIYRAY